MTQSEMRIYINTLAAEAMKDLRRLEAEIKKVEAATKAMRAASKGLGTGIVNPAAVSNVNQLNTALNTNASRSSNAARAHQNLARAKDLAVIAAKKLDAAQQVANTKMNQGTAGATAMAASYGRVAAAAGAASAAQTKLAASQAAVGATGASTAAAGAATSLLGTQRGYIDLQRQMGVAAAKGDEFGHRTQRSLFDTLAAVNDNESAMRKWGSQIQWTGRQMMGNLTMPLGLIAGMGGKVWFDQAQSMVQLTKVYGEAGAGLEQFQNNELDALGKKFTELSAIFGINREEVIGVAAEWAAAGASGVELAKATNLTMQAMVLGNLSAEESTKALIATQAQYGFSTDEMSRTLAQLNLVENETGVSMGGLIQAFSRTAGVAREAGMDTAHLASMIAAMSPAAGTAAEAGNGLKTIMTRLMKQTKDTAGTLEYMGINMEKFASLPMDKKLEEVAVGFEKLDDAQKGAAAGILAGGWQVNRMSVALRELTNENGYYHKSLNALANPIRVQETMMRELTKTLTSDPKKLQQAWQQLRNSMAQIFVPIVPYLLYFMNGIAQLAQSFSELPLPIQKLSVGIGLFLALLGPIIVLMGVFALVAASLKTPFIILGTIFMALVKGPFKLLGVALGGSTGMLARFGRAAIITASVFRLAFLGTMAGAVGTATALITTRISAMAAFVAGRFAMMTGAVAGHAAAHTALTVAQWVKVLAIDAFGWASHRLMLVANTAANLAMLARYWVAQRVMMLTNIAANLASLARYWVAQRVALVVNTAANLAMLARYWVAQRVMMLANFAANLAAILGHWATTRAILLVNTAANLVVLARYWATRLAMMFTSFNLMAAGLLTHWIRLRAIDLANSLANLVVIARYAAFRAAAFVASFNLVSAGLIGHWIRLRAIDIANSLANIAVLVRYAASRAAAFIASFNAVTFGLVAHWIRLRAVDLANTLANLAVLARYGVFRVVTFITSFNLVAAGLVAHWARLRAIDIGNWIVSHAITAANLLVKAALWFTTLDRITVKQLIFWAKANLMTKVGLMTMLKTVGKMLLRVAAVFLGPWGLVIAAAVGLIYVFRDQIKGAFDSVLNYFQNLPPAMAKKLEPLVNLWNNIVNGARSAFNALPGFIQAPLVAVVKFVKAAAMKIYELFSYINPFARHSPSLVENVNAGMDAVANRFSLASRQVGGSVAKMYDQIKALKDAAGGLDSLNANAKREEDIGKIKQVGGPNAGAMVSGYNAISGTVGVLKGDLEAVNTAMLNQEKKVKSLDAAVKAADAAIEGMNETLDVLKSRADAASAQLDAAKSRMDHFKNATIQGMGAAEDATFTNEMAQKRLQLQMKKLGDAAGEGTDKARDEYAKLQGDIETMAGKKMELQFAGAGSDVLGGYDQMISGLKGQQINIGTVGGGSGPGAEVDLLQKQLDELQRQAEIMDLEKALKFDPLARQIEKATSEAYELPFDTIIGGLTSSGAQVDSLGAAYDRASAAVTSQEAAIASAQAARDQLGKTYDAESEALDSLKTVYDGIETAIRDGEQALNDMVSSADTAIQRIEELERKRKEAGEKAKKAGEGGADSMSPSMQSLIAAEGSDPFPDVGGGQAISRTNTDILDQSGMIEGLDLEAMNGVQDIIGGTDMMKPFKDGWQKVVDWWNGVVFPLGAPLKKTGDEVGNIISAAFGGEKTDGPVSKFIETFDKVKNVFTTLWNIVKGFAELLWGSIFPAIQELGVSLKQSLGSELQTIGDKFKEHWPAIKAFGEVLWEVIKVIGIIAGVIIGVLVGAFILLASIVMNVITEVVGPLVAFIGTIIGAIVDLVMGVVGVITGLYNIIVGLFAGDWGRVLEGFKQLGTGILNILQSMLDTIIGIFKFAWDILYGVVKGIIEGIIDFFTTLWDVLVGHSIVPDTINAIIDWFKSLPGAVFEFVAHLVTVVIEFFTKLWNDTVEVVGNLIGGIVGFFAELPGKIWDKLVGVKDTILGFFGGARDWLYDAGKNIIDGLLNGAGALLGKLGNFFADKIPAGIIRDGFKKALGIESPAKEMMGPGADVVRGIMAGTESEMGNLDSLMGRVAGVVAATELVAPTVTAAGAALPAPVAAGPAPALPAATAAPAPVGITPEQSAQALAGFVAFDTQYDALMTAHVAGITAKHAAMYMNLAAQQSTFHAATLAAQATFATSFMVAVATMAAAIVAQYVTMMASLTSMMTGNTASWLAIIAAFIANFLAQWAAMIANLISQTQNMVGGVTTLWQTLAQSLGDTLESAIRPVFESFLPMLETLEGWFRSTVDNIGTIWGEIAPKTKDPARVVINDVYNTGLRTAWNSFNEFLGLKPLPEYTAKFATGGAVNFHDGGSVRGGGTGLSDSIPARLSRGEHVVTAREVQAAGGHRQVEAQRQAWKAGKTYADGPGLSVAAFRNGGAVGADGIPGYKYGGAIVGSGFKGGTPQIDSIANLIGKYFPGMTLISGWRFTDKLNHSKGLAVDASNGGDAGTPQMQEMARFFYKNYKPMLNELIHYPTNGFSGVSMGKDYNFGASTNAQHRNHVHISANSPLPAPGSEIMPIVSGSGVSMDWGSYIGDAFKQSMDAVRDKMPKFAGGIGQWPIKAIEKVDVAKKFLAEKAETMTEFQGSVDDSNGMVERWRPMMKAALIKQGYPDWANNDAILNRFMHQINHESSGRPDIIQQIQDINTGGNEAGGLGQIAKGTFAGFRDPSLPNDVFNPWSNLNAMVRYVAQKPNKYMDIGNGIGYDEGGVLPPTPGGSGLFFNHTGGPEAVLTDPQWDAVYRAAMATTEAEEVARGFRNAVMSGEYIRATETASKQIVRNFGPKVDELGIAYYDASKLVADTVAEKSLSISDQIKASLEGVQKFVATLGEIHTVGKGIYDKLEEDGVIKEIEESTKDQVAALSDIAKRVQAGSEINEAMLHEVGGHLAVFGQKAFEVLAKQPFETYAPIFDKLADLADMLPQAKRSYVPWAGLETDMTLGKVGEMAMVQAGNTLKGIYNVAQSVAGPILRNVSGIGGVISRFATENAGAIPAIMAAVTTGNPLLALPFLPQILDALFELIPMIIQAVIDIVPNLIEAIMNFFSFLNPFNVPSYDTLELAVKAANESAADVRSGKYQYERGANSDWRPTDDGTKNMNFYGDLSFPNVKGGDDAEGLVDHLSRMG